MSSDGYSCIPCPSGISIDAKTGDCSCGTNSVICIIIIIITIKVVIDIDETGK